MENDSRMIVPEGRPQAILEAENAGERYTNVSLLLSLVIAGIGGALTIGAALAMKGIFPYFHALILERGAIQYFTIFAFWFAMGMLMLKSFKLRKERKAFELDYILRLSQGPDAAGTQTMLGDAGEVSENADFTEGRLILVNRINKAIKQIRINSNPADVANVLTTVAETDAAIIDSSYVMIKYMVWAIPVIGFIGTIMGMTHAIGSFDAVLQGMGDAGFAGVKEGLGRVTGGLAVAFDTTFLALILSAVVNLFANGLQKQEEDLLSDVEGFTTDNIINRYSGIRDRVSDPVESLPGDFFSDRQPAPAASSDRTAETGDAMVRELKNLSRQIQVNTEEMLSQVGGVIEAVDGLKGMEVLNRLPEAVDEMRKTNRALSEFLAKLQRSGSVKGQRG